MPAEGKEPTRGRRGHQWESLVPGDSETFGFANMSSPWRLRSEYESIQCRLQARRAATRHTAKCVPEFQFAALRHG